MSRNVATMNEIVVEGSTVRVKVEGPDTAPAVVLSHMLGTDLTLWDNLAPELAKHFRVVRYDTRGQGRSEVGDAPFTLARLGRDAVAILDALGIERAHFCGESMGGAIGLWLLTHAPERIERAVIADSAAKLGGPGIWNARIAAALTEGMEQAVEPTIERWFSPAFAAGAPASVERVRALLRASPPAGYAACCAALRDMDLREAVRAVTHPVLVVRGADDPSVPAEGVRHLVEAMANATAIEFDARHCTSIEAEAAFAAAVVKFLMAKTATRRQTPRPAKDARARSKPTQRRGGGRGLVAARRPVASTTPVSGKAVAKASATRKTAARAAPSRSSAKTATRAAAPALRKETSPRLGVAKAAKWPTSKTASKTSPTKAAVGAKIPTRAKVASGRLKPATVGTASPTPSRRPAAARTPAMKAKPPTAATLRAAAKKTAGGAGTKAATRASTVTPPKPPNRAITATRGVAKASGKTASKAKPGKTAPVKIASAKGTATKSRAVKGTSVKSSPAKNSAAKAKPASMRRAASPAVIPRQSAGRGAPGPGRRKP